MLYDNRPYDQIEAEIARFNFTVTQFNRLNIIISLVEANSFDDDSLGSSIRRRVEDWKREDENAAKKQK